MKDTKPEDIILSGATFSKCRRWRYALWRVWDASLPSFVVIGLNPSTADEMSNDPTIRRCIGFAKREGCGGVVMLNLFAYRATDPKEMMRARDPIGPANNEEIRRWATRNPGRLVLAWGTKGSFVNRDIEVRSLIKSEGRSAECFGLTKGGHPRHPLYLRCRAPLIPVE